ncbi:ECF-type sigma factor [Anatilimnocola floriformis]|uniref:ECF-type sigma factor n=1 Tax=Anatilimnocola floriformis TaxID=2948575 RepID=UPI0020C4FB9F|nr:ECF-type sigma factor [Anatilimnocola floriformis]
MDSQSTIENLISLLRRGDKDAPEALWNRYYARLAQLAQSRLNSRLRKVVDEEDVALSVFDTFCRGIQNGKFPELNGHDSLWPLLMVLTFRKVTKHAAKQAAQKRGAGKVVGEADFGENEEANLLAQAIGNEPSPEFVVEMEEQCNYLLGLLSPELQPVARGKLEGLSNSELSDRLGCSLRTLERRLGLIRRCWQEYPANQ